jgi:hypothetical protein
MSMSEVMLKLRQIEQDILTTGKVDGPDEGPRFLHRLLTALGGALKRGILGKSNHDYMKQFTGSDEYWDRVIAAQLSWPQTNAAVVVRNDGTPSRR